MKVTRKMAVSLLLALVMLSLGACGQNDFSYGNNSGSIDSSGNDNTNTTIVGGGSIDVESIALNCSDRNLKYGESYVLVPTVRPFNATGAVVTWTVDNPKVCEVMKSGNNCKVTAVGAGQAIVTATCEGRTATCRFTVSESSLIVTAESIKIYGDVANIVVGSTREFTAVITPQNNVC